MYVRTKVAGTFVKQEEFLPNRFVQMQQLRGLPPQQQQQHSYLLTKVKGNRDCPQLYKMSSYLTWMSRGVSVFFEYDTPKIVHINSKRVGVLSRLVQACIIAYVIGFVIVYKKGYQKFDDVKSAVTSKVKGF